MPSDFLAWSYSRYKTWKTCPKQLYHTAVAKKWEPDHVPYIGSAAQDAGNAIDAAFTERISKGAPLPPQHAQWEPLMASVMAAPGNKFAQLRLAWDRSLQPSGYMDWNNTYLRVIYDLAIVNGSHAFIWDWKDGKVRLDEDQLKLFAATGFLHWPEVDTIDTSYVWLNHGIPSDRKYRRRELPELMQTFTPEVEKMQIAYKANDWPAKPGWACGYCGVNRAGKCPVASCKPKD